MSLPVFTAGYSQRLWTRNFSQGICTLTRLNLLYRMSQRAWDMIISSVISIAITIVFGYYFIYVGEKQREPTFYVDPIRTMIIDKENAEDAPLKLLKASNDTTVAINADVVSAYCYFFNQGQETIKRENVYAPIKIKVDTGAEILYFKVIKNSREVSGINIIKDTVDNSLIIDFKALEKDDGLVGQLIYEGGIDTQIFIEGGIDGAKNFKSELASIHPIYILISIFILLVASYILLLMNKATTKSVPKFLFIFSAIPALYLLLMIYKTDWFVDHKVPESLRVEKYVSHSKEQVLSVSAWFK